MPTPRAALALLVLATAGCAEHATGPRAAAGPAPARLALAEHWLPPQPPCALVVVEGAVYRQRVVRGRCEFPAGLVLAPEDVVTVILLGAREARVRFGPDAGGGAILVTTRRRAAAGARAS